MKTNLTLLAVSAFLLFFETAFAQADSLQAKRQPWDIRVGMSGVSPSANQVRRYSAYTVGKPLTTMYGDYPGPLTSTNNIGAEAMMHLSRRSAVGMGLSACFHNYKTYSSIEKGVQKSSVTSAAICILPTYRLYYTDKEIVRLYGGVSLGLTSYFNTDISGAGYVPKLAFNVSPIGIEVGRKWFGFMEMGLGTVFCGVSFGAGYKF
ncbi:MAG: hypothetical protein MJY50_00420 [Bacteroidales bacterium]|nr:hypothetical protein [Bacteroidales bacterium]